MPLMPATFEQRCIAYAIQEEKKCLRQEWHGPMVRDFLARGTAPTKHGARLPMARAADLWIAAARCAVDENFSAPANHGPSVPMAQR